MGIRHDFKIEIMQLIQTNIIMVMEFHSEVGKVWVIKNWKAKQFAASKRSIILIH